MVVPERDVLSRAGPGHRPVAGFPSPPAKKSRASGQDSLSVVPGGTAIRRSSRSRTSRVATLLDPGQFTAHGNVVRLASSGVAWCGLTGT